MLKIAISTDHGGFQVKKELIEKLSSKYEFLDLGAYNEESCNYAEFAIKTAEAVRDHKVDFGVVLCKSGEGVCIASNKVKGVRCGIGYNDEVAMLMRKHNNANVIAFGCSFQTIDEIIKRIDLFTSTEFEGGRHQVRVDTIDKY